jgi:hypothetical protein
MNKWFEQEYHKHIGTKFEKKTKSIFPRMDVARNITGGETT